MSTSEVTHELKTWPDAFNAVWRREKVHEIRHADRPFKVGDWLVLREWEPESEWTSSGHRIMPSPTYNGYTGRWIKASIMYITPTGRFGIPDDVCVMSIHVISLHGKWLMDSGAGR